jgi:hypothetical protein
LPFALPLILLLAFFVKVYGSAWHCGALALIAVAALWIASLRERTARPNPRLDGALNAIVLVALASLFVVQIYWSARTFAMDYSRPYSGSLNAANYLHSVGADASSTCGFGFHSGAVQPYFHDSIYQNWPKGEGFWRQDMSNRNNLNCDWAKWIVVTRCCTFDAAKQTFYRQDAALRSWGYLPVHFSRGSMFFEGREEEPTDFVVYELQH